MFVHKLTPEELNSSWNKHMTKLLDIEYTEIGDNYLCGKMPVNENVWQPMGILHGGASVVFAESLGSIAANLCVPETHYCVGLDINANHIKSVRNGFVYGKATAIHIGKTTQIWEILITNEQNEKVCISRLTMAVLEKRN